MYAVQRMLGHAKPSITLDVYGSLWDDSLEKLAESMDEAIRASREKMAGSGEHKPSPRRPRIEPCGESVTSSSGR